MMLIRAVRRGVQMMLRHGKGGDRASEPLEFDRDASHAGDDQVLRNG